MLQTNIEAVTRHIRKKLTEQGADDIDRKVLYGWVLTSAVSITSTPNMKSIPDTKLPFMKKKD